jgi:hypothetical protein
MVLPWIGRREPTLHISVQLVTYWTTFKHHHPGELKNDSRFDLFMSLAIFCIISNAQLETESVYVTTNIYQGHPGHYRSMLGHLQERR